LTDKAYACARQGEYPVAERSDVALGEELGVACYRDSARAQPLGACGDRGVSNRVYQTLIGRDEVAALRLGEREVE
jgi:hypothetical protein